MKYTQSIILAACAVLSLCGCAMAGHAYRPALYPAAVNPADVAAAAITDLAAAKASAAKLHDLNLGALHNYGHQIGVPLLVRPYGPLTNLYSALAPKRSFVGTVDSGFYKDSYGKLKFRDEAAVGAIAI